MKNVSWDELQIFAAVARAGGLSGASQILGLSPATVGRRMLALENAIKRPLFVRRQSGYALTIDGRVLLEKVRMMEAGMRSIAGWLAERDQRSLVRISAGSWTANFLASNFRHLWTPEDDFCLAFKTTEARLDIAHREVEIGMRNQPPQDSNLAARRLNEVAYAPFRARNLAQEVWVAIAAEDAITKVARWMTSQPGCEVVAWANTPRTLHDLMRAGIGKSILPCFAGDRDPVLERAGGEIPELREDQWIVMHNDDRHRRDVRLVIERIANLVTAHAALFAGKRPLGGADPDDVDPAAEGIN